MRLLLRHATASWGASALVAGIVFVIVFLAALAPRAVSAVTTEELRANVAAVAPEARDLTAVGVGVPVTLMPPTPPERPLIFEGDTITEGPPDEKEQQAYLAASATWHALSVAELYEPMDSALATLRDGLPEALRDALGPAEYYSRSEPFGTSPDVLDRDAPIMSTRLATDPRIEERVRIVEGAFPERLRYDVDDFPLEVMVSVETAEKLRWPVGQVRQRAGIPVVLAGTFEPVDPEASYWKHAPSVLEPQLFDDGNLTPEYTGVAYVNPLSIFTGGGSQRTTVWFPLDVGVLDVGEASQILPALRTVTDAIQFIPSTEPGGRGLSLGFHSDLEPAIDSALSRSATITALLALVASGPLGVALAVLTLGARAVVERRRPALALTFARGASGFQRRGALALEGAVIGLLPALAATALAAVVLPQSVGVIGVVGPALLGLAPAVILAALASPTTLRAERSDVGSPGRGRVRWIVEATAVLLAATATVLLFRRGLTTSAASIDPLLASTPLLLSLAVCVVVLRLYPLPLRSLAGALARRPGVVGFVGSARAVRDRSLSLEAVFALIVAVAVGVFSSVVLSTLDRGIESGAFASVGADIRVTGGVVDPATIASMGEIDGVAGVAGVDVSAPVDLSVDKVRSSVPVVVADTASLGEFRDLPEGLDAERSGAIPVVVSEDLAGELSAAGDIRVGGESVTVVGTEPRASGFTSSGPWVLVDKAFSKRLTGTEFLPQLVLIDLEESAETTTVVSALDSIAGPTATVTSYLAATEAARSAPATAGLRATLLAAVGVAVLLAALAVVLSAALGTASRVRVLTLLRTLGATDAQRRRIVVWEFVPAVTAAALAGTLLGLALPWLVFATVDLRPFTGGAGQPLPVADPVMLLVVLGAVAVTVAAAIVAAIRLARRANLTTTLRMGAD